MSIDWGNVAAAAGVGAVTGLNQFKAETKEKEERDYTRGRQAVQDKQQAELHGQTVKQNDFTLQSSAREQAEANRKQLLNERLGMYQNFKTTGDIDRAASTYVEFANKDNVGNPNFDPNQALSYVKNADGTVNINIVDRNTGALVRAARENVNIDDFVSATYQQLEPVKNYETGVDNAAKSALKQQEYSWEERKMGLQYGFDLNKENNKHNNTLSLEGYKHNNTLNLENIRQGGANYRAELGQEGQNYRATLPGKGTTGTGSGKASAAVASGVQGAIGFAQQNAPMLSFLSNQPDLYNKTVAMMGIESGGRNVPSYDGSSHGPMQINARYAQGFAKQFGINGNPVTDIQANIQTGAALINHLDKKYGGDTTLIAAAYNAGEPAIDAAVASWQQAGQQGTWFDHLRLKPEARQQVYGHIVKYNQALGYLGAGGQPTNITVDQVNQNNAQQTVNAKNNYRQGVSAQATAAIKNTATAMGTELGLDKGANAAIIGGLAGTQTEISKFANSNTSKERAAAYGNIYKLVDNAVMSTEAGQMMTPGQRKEYSHQKAAELVGATNKTEAGNWITNGRQGKKAEKPAEQSNLNTKEIDNVFHDINVGESTPAAKPAAKSGQAMIPLRNPMQNDAVTKAASRFTPPATTTKAAPKPAAKPKTKAEQNAEARAARKRAEADAVNKRVRAEQAAEIEADKKAKAKKAEGVRKPTPLFNQKTEPFYGGSAVEAARALKLKQLQNKS
ncbi:transglycosylase SLT domain-containing protein [Acinetobacter lwoffii]|uniref:transglycosylase SLT domain-containing protein n=2 Tax=Acinetobacter lwoffii TaxID=28090 RepID=UPI003BF683E7